jgi:hypothetical protein
MVHCPNKKKKKNSKMSSLPEGLQGILQVLMAKRTMTEEEAATLLARVKDQYHLEVPQDATVTGIFRTINKVSPLSFFCCLQSFMFSLLLTLDHLQELKFMSFEIRSLHMEGQLVHALVNLVWSFVSENTSELTSHYFVCLLLQEADEVAEKKGTSLPPSELDTFKKVDYKLLHSQLTTPPSMLFF